MDPSPPVSTEDDRPAVRDLLDMYRDGIDNVRDLVSADQNGLYTASLHDDLWMLRFYLSHGKNASKAAKAAIKTMIYRAEHGLDEIDQLGWLEPRTSQEMEMPLIFRAYTNHMDYDAVYHTQPHADRGVFVYVQLAGIHMTKIATTVSREEMSAAMRITNEFYFRVLDEVTRRTGRLTKMVRVIDMAGSSISRLDHRFLKVEGRTAKEIEDFYPQQLASVYLFNAPLWMEKAWKVFSHLIPTRTRKKVDIFSRSSSKSLPKNARVFEHIRHCDLPQRYGGGSTEWPPQGSDGAPGGDSVVKFPGGVKSYENMDIKQFVQF